jgi:F0F1-type ATP synthase assembly protein I
MNLWNLSSLGIEFAFIILASVFSGIYLDKKLGSSPWLLLLTITLGFSFGIYYVVKRANTENENDSKK